MSGPSPDVSGTSAPRFRRTKAELAQLDRQIKEALEADNPQSVRHTFYLMTDPTLPEPVEKTEQGYRQVQKRVKALRRSGEIPYEWIVDASRDGLHVETFDNAEDFLRNMVGRYRADPWRTSDWYCEVWVESRSIASVIEADCDELGVSLYPCAGFPSITLAYNAAEAINQRQDGKRVFFIYIGDYDPAGVIIGGSLEEELQKHLRPDIDWRFLRIAITPEQIVEHNLPTKPRKASDPRSAEVKESVEAEAMPPALLRELLREAVGMLLPPGALEMARTTELVVRERLGRVVEMAEDMD